MLERWGGFVARRAWPFCWPAWSLVIAAGAYGFGVFDSLSQGGFDDPDSEACRRARGRAGRVRQPVASTWSRSTPATT